MKCKLFGRGGAWKLVIWNVILLIKKYKDLKVFIEINLLGVSPNSIILVFLLVTCCFKNSIEINIVGMIEQHLFNSHEKWLHSLYKFIYWTGLEICHIGYWFEYTSLQFRVHDAN